MMEVMNCLRPVFQLLWMEEESHSVCHELIVKKVIGYCTNRQSKDRY